MPSFKAEVVQSGYDEQVRSYDRLKYLKVGEELIFYLLSTLHLAYKDILYQRYTGFSDVNIKVFNIEF